MCVFSGAFHYLLNMSHTSHHLASFQRRYRPGTMNLNHKHLFDLLPYNIFFDFENFIVSLVPPLLKDLTFRKQSKAGAYWPPARSSLWKLGFSQWSKNLSTMRTTKRRMG